MLIQPLASLLPLSINRKLPLFAALFFAWGASASAQQDGTWESATGGGQWNTSSNWKDNQIANGAGKTATFDGATGRTLTLDVPVTLGHINVTNWNATNWHLSGGTLTLDAESEKPTLTLPSASAVDSLRISSTIAGVNGFEKLGAGRLYLSGNNTFTGGVTVSRGTLWTSNAATLNSSAPNAVTMAGGTWLLDGSNQNYQNAIILANASSTLSNSSATHQILSGVISETGGSRQINFQSNGSATGFTLRGSNSYTGNTVIGSPSGTVTSIVLRIENDNALGTGTSSVHFNDGGTKTHDNDALHLAGGVTIDHKTLTLRGRGRDQGGSLRSIEGENTWKGAVSTGTSLNARIGVDAGRLTIEGVISGTSANGITKVGEGTLRLTAANTYSSGTAIHEGTLHVTHAQALAGGDLSVGNGTGNATLRIGAGTTLSVADLTLTGPSRIAFELTGISNATQIAVTGDQLGSGTYTIDLFDGGGFSEGSYTLMTVAGGAFEATNFILGNVDPGMEGSTLSWDNGILTLTHTAAVPEPGTMALFVLATACGAFLRYRRPRV